MEQIGQKNVLEYACWTREKRAIQWWRFSGEKTWDELLATGKCLRNSHWKKKQAAGSWKQDQQKLRTEQQNWGRASKEAKEVSGMSRRPENLFLNSSWVVPWKRLVPLSRDPWNHPLHAFLELLCVERLRQKELRSQDIHLDSSPIKDFTKAAQEQEQEAT